MWYLVLSHLKSPVEVFLESLAEHLAWMRKQHMAGNVLFSGPTPDRAKGIYVVRASSLEDAKKIIDSDPMHAKDLRDYELIPWEVHQVMGAGPFDIESLEFLAERSNDGSYTPPPDAKS